MDFSFLSRIAVSMFAPILRLYKKFQAVRKAAHDGLVELPADKIHDSTLAIVGADPSPESGRLRVAFDLIVRKVVESPVIGQAHVAEWMSLPTTRSHLKQIADSRIAGAPIPSDIRSELIESYMNASGDNKSRSSDFVDLVSSVLVASLMSEVKDDALSAQLQISFTALQRRFDKFDQLFAPQELPESGWSFDVACKANEEWLSNVFGNASKAKKRLGQPISPADINRSVLSVSRTELMECLDKRLLDSPLGGIVAVTGSEGNGKSWLVAQSWLSWAVKPLTLFISAEEILEDLNDPLTLIANKLCDQTDRQGNDAHQDFWLNQLRAWRKSGVSQSLRLLVVIDGLNQRPKTRWSRVIDLFSEELEKVCGKLILTSRKGYFDKFVRPALEASCIELPVPEWTVTERNQLLAKRQISPNTLHSKVAASLCNPRLLNVALTLLDSTQLLALEELSISRLLFEHLRATHHDSYGKPVEYFARSLQDHAKIILDRLDKEQLDDFNIFVGGLDAVQEGRFFTPLPNDLTRYSIQSEGLGLALGFAIVDYLRAALRNKHDLDETLALLTEPIEALDQTSEAILAALTIACVTAEDSPELGTSILVAFASVQNPDQQLFKALAALVRIRPEVFISAAQKLALKGGVVVNFDWIQAALFQERADPTVWSALSTAIENWLKYVSLDVQWRIISVGKSANEVAEQLVKHKSDLDCRISAFSVYEQDIFATLIKTDEPDVSVLGRLAFILLAGRQLAPFSQSILQWGLARSLNGNYQAPMKQLRSLIRFNKSDWSATREAVVKLIAPFRDDSTSSVGKWTLAALLDATGNPEDAREAQEQINLLRTDQSTYPGWHRNESYCRTDPCNPYNVEPENVAKTATEYAAIDVKRLFLHMGQNECDLFFNDARPAIARHHPQIAINQHRVLIDDLFCRYGPPLRQIVVGLLDHSALITPEQAKSIVTRACGRQADLVARDSLGSDAHIWTLFQLELAFPALDAITQLEVLLEANFGTDLSNNLIDLIKPLDVESFEVSLAAAINTHDVMKQFTVLLFSPFTKQTLSDGMLDFIPALLSSDAKFVQAYTFRVIAKSEDTRALGLAINCPIETDIQTSGDSQLLRWNYSAVLLGAALKGVPGWEKNLAKMSIRHLAQLAEGIGTDGAQYFAEAIDTLLNLALDIQLDPGILDIEITLDSGANSHPHTYSLRESALRHNSFDDLARQAIHDEHEFAERQDKLLTAFKAFCTSLVNQDANELLNQLSLDDLPSFSEIDTGLLKRWCELLLSKKVDLGFCATRNIALLLASAISNQDELTAVRLFEKYDLIRPLVKIMFNSSGIELGTMAVWSASDEKKINELRIRRLNRATNNDEFAREVWAAIWQGKSYILTQYIDTCLSSNWPAAQARGILAAGLMPENQHSSEVLKRFADVPGLLGNTQRIANEYYQRHIWAMHWYAIMRSASTSEEFWCAAVLFRVVADSRIEALAQFNDAPTTVFYRCWPGARRQLHNRFEKLRNKWKKSLFSDEAPDPLFISFFEDARSPISGV